MELGKYKYSNLLLSFWVILRTLIARHFSGKDLEEAFSGNFDN